MKGCFSSVGKQLKASEKIDPRYNGGSPWHVGWSVVKDLGMTAVPFTLDALERDGIRTVGACLRTHHTSAEIVALVRFPWFPWCWISLASIFGNMCCLLISTRISGHAFFCKRGATLTGKLQVGIDGDSFSYRPSWLEVVMIPAFFPPSVGGEGYNSW